MPFLTTRNTSVVSIPIGSAIDFGTIEHAYFKLGCNPTFNFNGNSLTIFKQGIYDVSANVSFTGDTAGNATFQWEVNGILTGPIFEEAITVPTTQVRSISVPTSVLVNSIKVLGLESTQSVTIRLIVGGIDITQTASHLYVNRVVGKGGNA